MRDANESRSAARSSRCSVSSIARGVKRSPPRPSRPSATNFGGASIAAITRSDWSFAIVDADMAEAEDAETGPRMIDATPYDDIFMHLRLPGMA